MHILLPYSQDHQAAISCPPNDVSLAGVCSPHHSNLGYETHQDQLEMMCGNYDVME
jgi:hypothetical protein